jgi:hypothetical protein
MKKLKAQQARSVQEMAWRDVMAWDQMTEEQTRQKEKEAESFFSQASSVVSAVANALTEQAFAERSAQAEIEAKKKRARSARNKRSARRERAKKKPSSEPRRLEPSWNYGHR